MAVECTRFKGHAVVGILTMVVETERGLGCRLAIQ
jgi:hypothetical protein